MKTIIILVFTLFHIANAQDLSLEQHFKYDTTFIVSINPKLPKYHIHISEDVVLPEKDKYNTGKIYYTVEIKSANNSSLIQTIKSVNSANADPLDFNYGDLSEDSNQGILIDINFDGFKDLRFKSGQGADVNQTYDFYIFNKKTKKFELNELVSNLTNPVAFSNSKIIYSYIRSGYPGTDGNVYEYKWNKNKLILTKKINYKVVDEDCTHLYWQEDCCCKYTQKIDYYKNDKIINSETKIIDVKDIPKSHLNYW